MSIPPKKTDTAAKKTASGVLALLLGALSLNAEPFTWNGASPSNGSWSTGANWVGGVAPTGATSADFVFDRTYLSGDSRTSAVINFSGATATAVTFAASTGSGFALSFQTGGHILNLAGAVSSTSGNHSISGGGSSGGLVLNAGSGLFDIQSGTTTIASRIAAGSASELTKKGAGTLMLENSGNAGITTIYFNEGVLATSNYGALGSASLVFNGGTYWFASAGASQTMSLPWVFNSAGGTIRADRTIAIGGAGGSITGTGDIIKTGTANLTLSVADGRTAGNWIVKDGAVRIGDANRIRSGAVVELDGGSLLAISAITLDSTRTVLLGAGGGTIGRETSGSFTVNGVISGAGNLTIGSGSVTLGGVNAYTGDTVVEATLTLANTSEAYFSIRDDNASNRIVGSGSVNLNGIFRLDISQLTDLTGEWNLVDVDTLAESFHAGTFGLSFAGGSAFANIGGGLYANGDWTFDTATGNLMLVPEPSTWALCLLTGMALFSARRLF